MISGQALHSLPFSFHALSRRRGEVGVLQAGGGRREAGSQVRGAGACGEEHTARRLHLFPADV